MTRERPFSSSRPIGIARGIAVALALCALPCVRADQIIAGDVNHAGGRVEGFEQGEVRYRLADGSIASFPVAGVDLLFIDSLAGFSDFNEAEAILMRDDAESAIDLYKRSRNRVDGFWRELLDARLLMACDRAGRFDDAVDTFIRVVQSAHSGAIVGAALVPRCVSLAGDAQGRAAVDRLDVAARAAKDDAQRVLLRVFGFDVLRRIDERRGRGMARSTAALKIPEALRTARVYEIVATALTFVFDASVDAEALEMLDRAIENCPDDVLPDFLLLKGRALLKAASTRDDVIRASWPLLRVAIHMPKDPRAAEALLVAATAMERIGKPAKALLLAEESLAHPAALEETKRSAAAEVARLRGESGLP
ncbi:MAG: hypothetical protein IIB61_01720 [Planctomycetes bacterium]|nr:hypothetical protein [Planctomycetota bacterium]